MSMYTIVAIAFLGSLILPTVTGHGYMIDPPNRASRWRENPDEKHKYYNDNELFCGGREVQWNQHKGKCGTCGDEYGIPNPRFTFPGKFAQDPPIVRSYTEGGVIEVRIRITANHKGFFVFKLAELVKPPIRQDQLDKMVLKLPTGESSWELPGGNMDFTIKLQLPRGFTCDHCVIQWWYHTGNNWQNDTPESFVNCADIAIHPRGSRPSPQPTKRPSQTMPSKRPSRPRPTRPKPSRPSPGGKKCRSHGPHASKNMDAWCVSNCARNHCPPSMCTCK